MVGTEEKISQLTVIKRNGKKVEFNGSKIALAIKKGFDNAKIENGDEIEHIYTEKDIQLVYKEVMNQIEKQFKDQDKIKIEEIQDLIEDALKKKGYEDICASFSEYRERRNQSRKLFSEEKKLHKFLKTIEGLGLKSSNEDNNKNIILAIYGYVEDDKEISHISNATITVKEKLPKNQVVIDTTNNTNLISFLMELGIVKGISKRIMVNNISFPVVNLDLENLKDYSYSEEELQYAS